MGQGKDRETEMLMLHEHTKVLEDREMAMLVEMVRAKNPKWAEMPEDELVDHLLFKYGGSRAMALVEALYNS